MIDLVFDTDCLSAFLWVRRENLLEKLYAGKIIIPQEVLNELSNPRIQHLRTRIDTLIQNKSAIVRSILVGTPEYRQYIKMTQKPDIGYKIIGKGEAAALSLAKAAGLIVASNNFSDISTYLAALGLRNMATGDILMEAHRQGLIDEQEGNDIWAAMLQKRRMLGALSFSDYMSAHTL